MMVFIALGCDMINNIKVFIYQKNERKYVPSFVRAISIFSSMIHEAHKQTILTGGLRIHALLQSTFEVRINDPDIG